MKYHFIGIGGIGMSGLAQLLKEKGFHVKGSNIVKNDNCYRLEELGIKLFYNHSGDYIEGDETIVYTTAIKEDNPELIKARSLSMKIFTRGEMLSVILNKGKLLGVAGSHGKTSSTSMLAQILEPLDPTTVVGGVMEIWNSNIKSSLDKSSNLFIAELDESDNSLLFFKPFFSIVTNIDYEHIDFHKDMNNLINSFEYFLNNSKNSIINIDDDNLYNISKRIESITYSSDILKNPDISYKIISGEKFEITYLNKEKEIFETNVRGKHNISNLIPIIYVSKYLGIPYEYIQSKIKGLVLPKRRLEVIYKENVIIVDDCAHHPTEIKASLEALNSYKDKKNIERIVLIFQPHRYSRTLLTYKLFKDVFNLADNVYITDIFSAGEENINNISSDIIYDVLDNKERISLIKDREKIIEIIKKDIKNQDLIVFMGLGDIKIEAYLLKEDLYKRI